MSTPREPCRIELKVPSDPRALSAVSGAVEFVAQRAGLASGQQKEVVAAVEEACRSAFRKLTDHGAAVGVIVEDHSDRIEITLELSNNELPAVGLEEIVASASGKPGSDQAMLARMDRVQFEVKSGISRMKLVKFVAAPRARS